MKDSDDESVSDKNMADIPVVVNFCYKDFTVKENVISAKCKFCSEETIISDETGTSNFVEHLQIFHSQRLKQSYEKLLSEEVRLRSFHSWPSTAWADPQVLAREGLFYTGTDDRVQCTFCRGILKNWEPADIPSVEHKKHFPDCPFVRGQDIGNIPISREPNDAGRKTDDDDRKALNKAYGKRRRIIQERLRLQNLIESTRASTRKQVWAVHVKPPKFPGYDSISQRFSSFLRGHVSQGQTAEGLAEAGWFWIGPGDNVQCFQCGVALKEWEPKDDPWMEHKKFSPNCSHVKNHFTAPRRQFQEPAQMDHKREKMLVEEKFSNIVSDDGRTGHCRPDDILLPNASSLRRVTTGFQVEDAQLDCYKVVEQRRQEQQPCGTLVAALMDREEIQMVLRIMGNCDSNKELLKTLISERLSRDEECLIPAVLLDAVFRKYAS